MDTFLKLLAVFVLVAVMRTLIGACLAKAREEMPKATLTPIAFALICAMGMLWAIWHLGAQI